MLIPPLIINLLISISCVFYGRIKNYNLFHPLVFLPIFLFLNCGLKCILTILGFELYLPYASMGNGQELLYPALVNCNWGIFSFAVGSVIVIKLKQTANSQNIRFLKTPTSWSHRKFVNTHLLGLLFLLISLLGFAIEIRKFGYNNFMHNMNDWRDTGRIGQGYSEILKNCILPGMTLLSISDVKKWIKIAIIISFIPIVVFTGSKFAVMYCLWPAFFLGNVDRPILSNYRIKNLFTIKALGNSIKLLLLITFLIQSVGYMTYLRLPHLITGNNQIEKNLNGFATSFSRFHALEVFSLAIDIGYPRQNGDWLLDIPRTFVPRSIWPDKPIVKHHELSVYVKKPDKRNDFYNTTFVGFFFYDFGLSGLIICTLLCGFFITFIYNFLNTNNSNLICLVLQSTFSFLFIGFVDGSVQYFFVKSFYLALLIIFILKLSTYFGFSNTKINKPFYLYE